MLKVLNKAVEELVKEKSKTINEIRGALDDLDVENFKSLEPASTDSLKVIFENVCKFMKMDNAIVSLRGIEKTDFTDLIKQANEE